MTGAESGLRLATSFIQRACGLLREDNDGVLLVAPCGDVHTFGMRHPVDVAFVDAEGTVISVAVGVRPGRRLRETAACAVLERMTSDAPWFDPGDRLVVLAASKEE